MEINPLIFHVACVRLFFWSFVMNIWPRIISKCLSICWLERVKDSEITHNPSGANQCILWSIFNILFRTGFSPALGLEDKWMLKMVQVTFILLDLMKISGVVGKNDGCIQIKDQFRVVQRKKDPSEDVLRVLFRSCLKSVFSLRL